MRIRRSITNGKRGHTRVGAYGPDVTNGDVAQPFGARAGHGGLMDGDDAIAPPGITRAAILRWSRRRYGLEGRGAAAALFLAAAALSFGTFALAADAGLLVKSPLLHFLEYPLLGELALEHAHRLIEGAFNSNFHSSPEV